MEKELDAEYGMDKNVLSAAQDGFSMLKEFVSQSATFAEHGLALEHVSLAMEDLS